MDAYLDSFGGFSDSCDDETSGDYDDGLYAGLYIIYEGCGGTGAAFVRLVSVPIDGGDYMILFEFQAVEDRDFDALDVALSTFIASGG